MTCDCVGVVTNPHFPLKQTAPPPPPASLLILTLDYLQPTAVSLLTAVELGTSAACSYAAQCAGARVSLLQCCSAGRPGTEELSADFIFLGVKRKHPGGRGGAGVFITPQLCFIILQTDKCVS